MTHAEFVEWQVIDRVAPFGDARADLHNAMQMALMTQIHRGKRGKRRKVEDFVPDWWRERPIQTLRNRLMQADAEARQADKGTRRTKAKRAQARRRRSI